MDTLTFELDAALHPIADALWAAQSAEDVAEILREHGHSAHVVHQLMIAAAFDQVEDVTEANEVLERFR